MAGYTDNSITYTGDTAKGWYSTAILSGATKSKIRQFPNVKSSMKVGSLDVGTDLIQPADCVFSSNGTITLAQKTLSVCDLKINLEFCVSEFESNYLSEVLKAGSNGAQVPENFSTYMMEQMALQTGKSLETATWTGDISASPSAYCDGFLTRFATDADVIDVTATTLTSANIVAELAKVYNAIPDSVASNPDMKLWVSPKAASLYKLASATVATGSGSYMIGDRALDYLGLEMISTPGMPTNEIVAATTQNLWMATDLVSDFEDVKIIDMYETTGSPNIRFVAKFKYGVNYGVGGEIVYYA